MRFVIKLVSKGILFNVGIDSKSSLLQIPQKLSVLAFPKRIDFISVPAKTIPKESMIS
jgi:hypothetical protein